MNTLYINAKDQHTSLSISECFLAKFCARDKSLDMEVPIFQLHSGDFFPF